MLPCLPEPSSLNQRATHFQFFRPLPVCKTFSLHYCSTLCFLQLTYIFLEWGTTKGTWFSSWNTNKRSASSALYTTPFFLKITMNFIASNVTLLQNKWTSGLHSIWEELSSFHLSTGLYRTTTYTVISCISAANYKYLLLGLCTCLEVKRKQFS